MDGENLILLRKIMFSNVNLIYTIENLCQRILKLGFLTIVPHIDYSLTGEN